MRVSRRQPRPRPARPFKGFFSIRRIEVKRFRVFYSGRHLTSFTGPCFSSGSALWPSHYEIGRMRRPNLSRVLIAMVRSIQEPKRTHLIHRPAKDIFPPAGSIISFPSVCSDSCGRVLPCPAEFGTIAPHAMHDHRQPACECNDGLLPSAPLGDVHRPGFQPGPFLHAAQHILGRLVKQGPHHAITAQ